MAKNKVIAGTFEGYEVYQIFGTASIALPRGESVDLTKENVESYQVIDESFKKSTAGVIFGSAVGIAIFGAAGILAGDAAKNKGTHVVAIKFGDGDSSLLEVDDKIYKAIITKCF